MSRESLASARALFFVAPRAVELRDVPLGPAPAGHVLLENRLSAISAGTERLAWRGELPPDTTLDETLGTLGEQTFRYPFRYGYASVGTIEDCGAGVPTKWLGQRVFAFCPHASAAHVPVNDLVALPTELPDEAAVLLASMETAVNLVLDAAPLLGERVMVLGQGVVGLLTTALLGRFPLEELIVAEENAERAALAQRLGARAVFSPAEARHHDGRSDLVLELSGQPAALDLALQVAGQEARIVVGSWYGDRRAPVNLGDTFHRRRLRIISSQVSHIAPALSARWTRARRFDAAFAALARLADQGLLPELVSHRVPFASAPEAYALLDSAATDVLQILLVHAASAPTASPSTSPISRERNPA